MSENLKYWEMGREVPTSAQKKIQGGNLGKAGFTDINPVWRIKKLTEMFGMCGIGWYTKTINTRFENGSNGEVAVFITINLFIKIDGEWSQGIEGQGGSSFISNNKNGLYTSDEAIKMASTDALSVCCKLLGIGADIYFEKDRQYETKYEKKEIVEKKEDKKIDKVQKTDGELRLLLGNMLIEMEGGKEQAIKKLKEITTFEIDGKYINGVDSLEKLKENRLKTTYGKVKQSYELWKKNNKEGYDI
jgi:hypothetical protein